MTHNEKRTVWWKEGLAALITGALYGVTNAVVGHPLDTIKTKMQVQSIYKEMTMFQSCKFLYCTEGVIGFFRGVIPPILGGSVYRSLQFAAFEAVYTKLGNYNLFTTPIPNTAGLEPRILVGAFASGTIRTIIECPFEYSKVQRQTGQVWKLKNMYQGSKILWMRSTALMTNYFIMVDFFRRNTNVYKNQFGIFFMNGICATIGFSFIWPLEIAKNQIQSMSRNEKYSIIKILVKNINDFGIIKGLYRGCLPGLLSVFFRNGVAMIVMVNAQKSLTFYGFRK